MQLELPALVILAGSSKSGKTHALKSLLLDHTLNRKNGFKFGLVFTSTKFNCEYSQNIPDKYILEGFDINILYNFVERIKDKYGKTIEKNIKKGISTNTGVPPSFIIFDDIISSINQNDKFFKCFISTFRHYNISVFISVQYIHQVSPLIRQQANYAFIFHHEQKKSIESLFYSFGGSFENEKQFKNFLQDLTKERYHCLVYIKDEYEKDKKYLDYKAPAEIPKIKLKY